MPFPSSPTSRVRPGLVLLLGALTALGPFTIDLYLPALPTITDQLNAGDLAVQLTLTGTLLGLGVGQLLVGPLSDALGRRRPLIAGVALHVLASLACAAAPSIEALAALRVLQGLGAAAAMVVVMAMVRDLTTGREAARLLSRLMLVLGAAPVLAPTVGGFLLQATSWRGVFLFLALAGLVLTAAAAWRLPETLPVARRRRSGVRETAVAYRGLFRDRSFVGLVLVAGFGMAAVFSYVAGSSFVLQEEYGLSQQQFGLVFGAGAIGLIGATQLNPRLLDRWSPQAVMSASAAGSVVAGAVLVVTAATDAGGLPGLLVPLWAVLIGCGLTLPNAPALALSRHGERAGTAAALLGAAQNGIGALSAVVLGALGISALTMASVVAGSTVLALAALVVGVRPRTLTVPAPVAPELAPAAVAGPLA